MLTLVVCAIEVLAVPAGWEVVDCHDTSRAGGLGELGRLGEAGHDVLQTGVAKTRASGLGGVGRRANSHAETLRYGIMSVTTAVQITYEICDIRGGSPA